MDRDTVDQLLYSDDDDDHSELPGLHGEFVNMSQTSLLGDDSSVASNATLDDVSESGGLAGDKQRQEKLKLLTEKLAKERQRTAELEEKARQRSKEYVKQKQDLEVEVRNLKVQAVDEQIELFDSDDEISVTKEAENLSLQEEVYNKILKESERIGETLRSKQKDLDAVEHEFEHGIDPLRRDVCKRLVKFEALVERENAKQEIMSSTLEKMEKRLVELKDESSGSRSVLLSKILKDSDEKTFSNMKLKLKEFKRDLNESQSSMLEKIIGENGKATDGEPEKPTFENVCISELTRLYLQVNNFSNALSQQAMGLSAAGSIRIKGARDKISGMKKEIPEPENEGMSKDLRKLVKAHIDAKDRNESLIQIIEVLEKDLLEARKAHREVQRNSEKLQHWLFKHRSEKDLTMKVSAKNEETEKKVIVLTDHIEKLMNHLKHEVQAKGREYEVQRKVQKEVDLLLSRNESIAKKNNAKDRIIAEMKEGARILEDQLRLMDEKYVELRTKLDAIRDTAKYQVDKMFKRSKSIRLHYELSGAKFSIDAIPLQRDTIEKLKSDAKLKHRKLGKNNMPTKSSSAPQLPLISPAIPQELMTPKTPKIPRVDSVQEVAY